MNSINTLASFNRIPWDTQKAQLGQFAAQVVNEVPGLFSFDTGRFGPHTLFSIGTHGGEIQCGLAFISALAEVSPEFFSGTITVCVANLEASNYFFDDARAPDDSCRQTLNGADLNRLPLAMPQNSPINEYRRATAIANAVATLPPLDNVIDVMSGADSALMIWERGDESRARTFLQQTCASSLVFGFPGLQRDIFKYRSFSDIFQAQTVLEVDVGPENYIGLGNARNLALGLGHATGNLSIPSVRRVQIQQAYRAFDALQCKSKCTVVSKNVGKEFGTLIGDEVLFTNTGEGDIRCPPGGAFALFGPAVGEHPSAKVFLLKKD